MLEIYKQPAFKVFKNFKLNRYSGQQFEHMVQAFLQDKVLFMDGNKENEAVACEVE